MQWGFWQLMLIFQDLKKVMDEDTVDLNYDQPIVPQVLK